MIGALRIGWQAIKRQYQGSPRDGHWHSRLPKSQVLWNKGRSGFFPAATPCILRISTHHLIICLLRHSVIGEFLSAPPLHIIGLGIRAREKSWQMGVGRHFEEDITCSVEATVETYILCLPPPGTPLSLTCVLSCPVLQTWDITIGKCHAMTQTYEPQ